MPAYRIVVPPPWEQVPLGDDSDARLDELVENGLKRLPPSMSPDEVGPLRRTLRHRLGTAVMEARRSGGSDIFLPTDSWHGFHLGASFVVAQVAPPIDPPSEITAESYVPLLMAQLLEAPGARVVSTVDSQWVRTVHVRPAKTDADLDMDVPTVSVGYLTPTPDALGTWTSVTYSTIGDGDPESQTTALSIELFDAIMSTWAWGATDDPTG